MSLWKFVGLFYHHVTGVSGSGKSTLNNTLHPLEGHMRSIMPTTLEAAPIKPLRV